MLLSTPKVFYFDNYAATYFKAFFSFFFSLTGENLNITWSPDGNSIAVGNKDDLVTFIDARMFKIRTDNLNDFESKFKFEVNEIEWNKSSNLFFLTSGEGCIHIFE